MSPASGAGRGRVTIRSMSCRGVKAFVPFQKPPLYAAVSLGGRREKTPADAGGGENPDWDGAVVAFDLDGGDAQQLVQFEVKAQVPLLGNKLVGTASVPVADLAAAGGEDGAALRHVSYQVSAPDGKPNGTLSFAYAISSSGAGGPQIHTAHDGGARPEQGPTFFSAPPPPVTAYPAPSSTANNFAPHGGGSYLPPPQPSPPVSGSLYPPLQDLLPSSTYPPPPPSTLPHPTMANPHFPGPNSSCYPPPAAPGSIYPPPAAPGSIYPPQPVSGSAYHMLPRSAPSPSSSTVDRELPYYHPSPSSTYHPPPPGGGSYYPPPELDGAARTHYYYPPPPGSRYP